MPTLVLHGDDDQIVPIGAAGLMSSKIVKGAQLKVYPGYPHGMCQTHADEDQCGPAGVYSELVESWKDPRRGHR